jgi:hypothetical protein
LLYLAPVNLDSFHLFAETQRYHRHFSIKGILRPSHVCFICGTLPTGTLTVCIPNLFPPKEKHNVGLLRFDDDHDHICYRFAQVRIFCGKSNVFKSLQHIKPFLLRITYTIFFSNLHNKLFDMLRNQVGISHNLASLLYSRSSAEIITSRTPSAEITSRTLLRGDNNFTDVGQFVRCHDNEVTL